MSPVDIPLTLAGVLVPERPQRSEGRAGANANVVFNRLALAKAHRAAQAEGRSPFALGAFGFLRISQHRFIPYSTCRAVSHQTLPPLSLI